MSKRASLKESMYRATDSPNRLGPDSPDSEQRTELFPSDSQRHRQEEVDSNPHPFPVLQKLRAPQQGRVQRRCADSARGPSCASKERARLIQVVDESEIVAKAVGGCGGVLQAEAGGRVRGSRTGGGEIRSGKEPSGAERFGLNVCCATVVLLRYCRTVGVEGRGGRRRNNSRRIDGEVAAGCSCRRVLRRKVDLLLLLLL